MKIAERHSERTLSRKEFLNLMDQEFAADRAFPLTVTGSSMEPLLRNLRDQVILVSAQSRPFAGETLSFSGGRTEVLFCTD